MLIVAPQSICAPRAGVQLTPCPSVERRMRRTILCIQYVLGMRHKHEAYMRSMPAILIARYLIRGEFPSNPAIFLIITLLYFTLPYSPFLLSLNMVPTNISTPAHPPRAHPSIYSRTTLQSTSDVTYALSSVISIVSLEATDRLTAIPAHTAAFFTRALCLAQMVRRSV